MADVLGVDLDVTDRSAPFVITADVPESVLRTAEFVRQRQVRDEWCSRKARGEIPQDDGGLPPGLSPWLEWQGPLIAGVTGGAALGLLVQIVAGVLGLLFGFHPGPVGLLGGVLGGVAACLPMKSRLDKARDTDMELLEANQRKITNWHDLNQMVEAHEAAMAVIGLWQHLPVREEPVLPRLRKALWALAGILPERQQLADTLGVLRRATVGVPADDPAARELAAQIEHADMLHRAKNAEVRERIEHITALAAECQRFRDEQEAIQRARQVSRQAESVLGMVGASRPGADITGQRPSEDTRAYERQLAAIQDAYRTLGRDVSGSS
jgi:hypothetical protein